jgi:zinc protease
MLDRKIAPGFTVPSKIRLLNPEIFGLSNGTMVYVLNGGQQPVARIELIFTAGRWHETLPGRSYFTAKMLSEGSLNYTGKQIANIFDRYGAYFEAHPGFDYVNLTLHSLSEKLHRVVPVLIDIITNPSFNEDELQKLKDIYVQNLAVNLEKNSYVASKLVRENLFGKSHPYGSDLEINDVFDVSIAELRNFHVQNFSAPQVFITGSISENQLNLITKSLEELKFSSSTLINPHEINSSFSNALVDKTNSIQSSIKLAAFCANRNDEAFYNLQLFNQIFGGYFGSRLMKNIREDKGLTYGISAGISTLKNKAFYTISAEVNKENKEIVIQEIYNELHKLSQELVHVSEFNSAINNYIGSMQSDLSTLFAHMDKIKVIHLNNLPENHYENLINHFSNASPETIIQIADSLSKTEFLKIVVG